ncbi:MAG: glycosyltransferase [Thermoleophilaceae bacterium]
MRRIVVLATGPLAGEPLGSGIRALELARGLTRHGEVTLAVAGDSAAVGAGAEPVAGIPCVAFNPHDPRALEPLLARADLVLATPRWPRVMRMLRRSGARLVFDLYDPEPLALIPGFPGARPVLRRRLADYAIDRVAEALAIGDQFLCSSERQRDLWLGMMLSERLVGLARYDHDPSLRSLIDVVPFGLSEQPPAPGPGARARFETIGERDEVVLWNGGLWPWLDAETPIRAAGLLAARRPLRLVFMGAAPALPARRAGERARELAAELGLLDRHVFFNDRWVPHEARGGWLLEADCAVSAHGDQLETRFSFRTRLLDCLWSGLPIVCTGGDEMADLVAREQLGAVADPGDPQALATALEQVLDRGRGSFEPAFAATRGRFAWGEVSRPLARLIDAPAPPRARGRGGGPARALRRGVYLGSRRALDAVGVRDWPRV